MHIHTPKILYPMYKYIHVVFTENGTMSIFIDEFLCVGDDALAHLEEKKRVTLFFATNSL